MAKIYATTNPQISLREEKNMARARRIAAEGMVLLENDGIAAGWKMSRSLWQWCQKDSKRRNRIRRCEFPYHL